MKPYGNVWVVLLGGLSIGSLAHAGIVYSGSFTTANNTATYSITTDGAIGQLSLGDIVSVAFSDTGTLGFPAQEAVPPQIVLVGPDLSATATGLTFDFTDNTSYSVFQFVDASDTYFLGFYNTDAAPPNGFENVVIERSAYEVTSGVPAELIAQTPEPGALVTTLSVSMILGLAGLRRRRQARRS
jgi:hypothetical protein